METRSTRGGEQVENGCRSVREEGEKMGNKRTHTKTSVKLGKNKQVVAISEDYSINIYTNISQVYGRAMYSLTLWSKYLTYLYK